MRFPALFTSLTCLALSSLGCDCGSSPPSGCSSADDCDPGLQCIDGACVPRADVGVDAAAPAPDAFAMQDDVGRDAFCAVTCGAACCAAGERCFDGTTCIRDRGACTSADECGDDSYCDGSACIPYGVPASRTNDPSCTRSIDIEAIVPDVQCRWTAPPAGDAFPNHFQAMSTPVVVDFNFDDDPATLSPSIVFATFPTAGSYTNPGVLRIVDGGTCAQQFTLGGTGENVMSPASAAVGDIDGDGRAEVVAVGHSGGLLAWGYDSATRTFVRRFRSALCAPDGTRSADAFGGADQWGGPSIYDLDDDGIAEILYAGAVYRNDGCRIVTSIGYPAYRAGLIATTADVDHDGRPELIQGNGVFGWTGTDWELESYFTATGRAHGHVAVAELGDFPLVAFPGENRPEIVVVSNGQVRVQTIEGAIVFGPITIPGGGSGGAPTIADFDGDGRREFASAGGSRYVVFDFDCLTGGDPARCGGMTRTNGVLWDQPSQDSSSNRTGSSVFDFDADGAAEAVYADECFLRVYSGATGTVLYSAARSSGTTYENPVIADVDGDFHSEIVSTVNDYAGRLGCPATDPLFPAASFATNHGLVVLRDVMDRWAASRPVWNQHAYSVTHVGDHGETPRSSLVARNWSSTDLNNFRQNVQGDLDALGIPDLTASEISGRLRLPCDAMDRAMLRARVCNRGALPMAAGFEVSFRTGSREGAELCRASSPTFLGVGECDEIGCLGALPVDRAIDIYVVTDPDGSLSECHEGNNWGLQPNVGCDSVL